MRLLFLTALSIALIPSAVRAQTWQEWVKNNPTYPNAQPPAPAAIPAPPAPAAATPAPAQLPPAPIPAQPPAPPAPASTLPAAPPSNWPVTAQDGYPEEIVREFMRGCTVSSQNVAFCECAIDTLQVTYSLEEFIAVSYEMLQTGTPPADVMNTVSVCIPEFG